MQNSDKLEKSKGILAFAYNTDVTDYVSIANTTLELAGRMLNLPYTLITDTTVAEFNNTRFDADRQEFVQWRNVGRNAAYYLSPYDETLVIDVDYVVTNNSLLDIFNTDWDYLLQRRSYSLTENLSHSMGNNSLPYVWATVFAFRKTPKAKMFFDLIERIQGNYAYYRDLFNIRERNYRNDYAFAIADIILNGYVVPTVGIPGQMLTINQSVQTVDLKDNSFVIKDSERAYIVPRTNLHILSKRYLQSDNFKQFVNNVTA